MRESAAAVSVRSPGRGDGSEEGRLLATREGKPNVRLTATLCRREFLLRFRRGSDACKSATPDGLGSPQCALGERNVRTGVTGAEFCHSRYCPEWPVSCVKVKR
eukprot:6212306-Pleurochrysis_carterae.AAC.1